MDILADSNKVLGVMVTKLASSAIGSPGLDDVVHAVTGWGTEEHKRRIQEAGFDVHLTKPVDLDAVEKILATV